MTISPHIALHLKNALGGIRPMGGLGGGMVHIPNPMSINGTARPDRLGMGGALSRIYGNDKMNPLQLRNPVNFGRMG